MEELKVSYCSPKDQGKPCVRWIEEYFNDCLCNLNDEVSFAFGVVSLICWGVAEIPQIITNFQNKSGHGVSLAFLFTWILGDIFNLVGCMLEPATLPTQFYTALLYTTTTVILVLQCLFYDYFLHWWKCWHVESNAVSDETKPLNPRPPLPTTATSRSPVEVPRKRDFYYTSARSMAGSSTPPTQCYIKATSVPSRFTEHNSDDQSSEDEAGIPVPLKKPISKPLNIPRSTGYYGTFLAGCANYLPRSKALKGAYVTLAGRKLLQGQGLDQNAYGQWLGWLMAAIYMGGRVPQIWLNIKRGSVEGLNPLMFILALVANATYVGSILVRSTEWQKIKANLPWLVDAIVCVVLDLFIILQYIYYKYIRQKKQRSFGSECYGEYTEANKVSIVS